ncbi:MAG: hypothetical protein QM655_16220 [Nocardioidaceae bacterium]
MSESPPPTPAPRQARHLMTPGQPRPVSREPMTIGTVQKWVLSILAATTIIHLSIGMVLLAAGVDENSRKLGLLALSFAFALVAVGAALLIHGKSLLSPWLLVALLPPAIGAWWVFGR